jgi:phage-related tail protein
MVVKLSYIILFTLLISVILNAVYISRFTDKIYTISSEAEVDDLETFEKTFEKIKKIYNNNEIFVSLSVSHEDLTSIQEILAEIEGAMSANDKNAVIIAKSRFESAVLHLGQLSALNIESIF